LLSRLDHVGGPDFIHRFAIVYSGILLKIDKWLNEAYSSLNNILIADIDLPEDSNKEQAIVDSNKKFINLDGNPTTSSGNI